MKDEISLSDLVEIILLKNNDGTLPSDEEKILEALKEAEKYLAEQLTSKNKNKGEG